MPIEAGAKAVQMQDDESHRPLGLRVHVLTPLETLAQSVSTIAPSTSPMLTIPLVFALAGDATWIAYLLALACMILIALCIAILARDTASPGSLYAYTRSTLPPSFGTISAWALLFAYVTTASSMAGGVLTYAYDFCGRYGQDVPPALMTTILMATVVWVAYHDIRISTQAMLWIEGGTMFLITAVLVATLWKHGPHIDTHQLRLHRRNLPGVQLGVILAIFSFVGFESATTLGTEARDPLRTIPRAVVLSAMLAGAFFILCSYTEVLGFADSGHTLDASAAPLRILSASVGLGVIAPVIDLGVLVSMFACMLACVIAASRVLLLMAHHGLVHQNLRRTHVENETPWVASVVTGLLAALPTAILAQRGASGADIYGWMGSCAVYGFLTAYGFVAVGMPIYLHRQGRLRAGAFLLASAAVVATVVATLGSLFPQPPPPYRYFPYLYGTYLLLGICFYLLNARWTSIRDRSDGQRAA